MFALGLVACRAPHARTPDASVAVRPVSAAPALPTVATPCQVEAPRDVSALRDVPRILAAAEDADGTLVVYPRAAAELALVRLPSSGAAHTASLPIRNAEGLLAVARVSDEHVLVTEGPCEAETRCLTALRLGADGRPNGTPLTVPVGARVGRSRRTVRGGSLFIAFSGGHGHRPWVDELALADVGLRHARKVLDRMPETEKEDVVVALTSNASGFAVLHRVGAPEDPAGALVLETSRRAYAVDALEEIAMIDRFVPDGDGFALVASFEFDRPLFVRLHANGTLVEAPRAIAPNERRLPVLGAPLAAALGDEGRTLDLVVETVGGDVLARARIADRPDDRVRAATVTRTPGGFLVPHVAPGTSGEMLRVRTVRCPEQDTP